MMHSKYEKNVSYMKNLRFFMHFLVLFSKKLKNTYFFKMEQGKMFQQKI